MSPSWLALEPVGQQAHTYGISLWIPFYGTGVNSADCYVFSTQMAPHITACYDMRRTEPGYDAIRLSNRPGATIVEYSKKDQGEPARRIEPR